MKKALNLSLIVSNIGVFVFIIYLTHLNNMDTLLPPTILMRKEFTIIPALVVFYMIMKKSITHNQFLRNGFIFLLLSTYLIVFCVFPLLYAY